MNTFKLVVRNITRRKGRFIFTLLGIAIGMAAFVALLALGGGMRAEIRNQAHAMGSNLIVTPTDWCTFDQISIFTGEPLPASLSISVLDEIRSIDGILAAPYLTQASAIDMTPVAVIGVEVGTMQEFSNWEMADGQYFSTDTDRSVVLGSDIADQFDLGVGQEVTIRGEGFPVIGVLEPVGNLDDLGVYLPIPVVQEAFEVDDNISYIGVQVENVEEIESYTAAILDRVNVAVSSDEQLLESVLAILGSVEVTLQAVAAISLIAASFGIINTMMTAIYERRREIGILRSIGSKRIDIFKIFMLESAIYGLLGGVLGSIIGALVSLFAAPTIMAGFDQIMKGASLEANIEPMTIVIAIGLSVAIAVVAGLYPAWKASNLTPVEAISYE
ncbi:MAG: ABC transporter permease [Coriobacteriia bacterium]|nr:ABC transporter permease [Coriobacteriia bacterium]MCL2746621.1 ABC transporter permease [Coriobacteriia bacterium]MCL2870035.1 ABC transporter permease [Coriobacteriia bacterium]